jgi:agmatinase
MSTSKSPGSENRRVSSAKLELSSHFERVPGSDRHAFVRSWPDRVCELTPDTFSLLAEFKSPRLLDEVVPGASEQHRVVVETLVEIGVLLADGDRPPAYEWAMPAEPLFGLPVWPRVLEGKRRPIVAVGARFDDATLPGYPRGAREGPTALRRASRAFLLRLSGTGPSPGLPRVELGDRTLVGVAMADAGDLIPDVGCSHAEFADGLERRLRVLGERASVLLLGGDHSVALAAIRALVDLHPRIGVLHFDAHGDFGVETRSPVVTHANVMRHVLAVPQVERLVQVGVRGFQSLPHQSDAYRRFTPEQVRAGVDDIVATIDPDLAWYVSLDIDVLDPAVAPGTGAPEPDGLSYADLRTAIRACTAGRRIIGADLVEVQDIAGDRLTGRVGAQLLIELAAAMDQS